MKLNIIRKATALILCATTILSLGACGSKENLHSGIGDDYENPYANATEPTLKGRRVFIENITDMLSIHTDDLERIFVDKHNNDIIEKDGTYQIGYSNGSTITGIASVGAVFIIDSNVIKEHTNIHTALFDTENKYTQLLIRITSSTPNTLHYKNLSVCSTYDEIITVLGEPDARETAKRNGEIITYYPYNKEQDSSLNAYVSFEIRNNACEKIEIGAPSYDAKTDFYKLKESK